MKKPLLVQSLLQLIEEDAWVGSEITTSTWRLCRAMKCCWLSTTYHMYNMTIWIMSLEYFGIPWFEIFSIIELVTHEFTFTLPAVNREMHVVHDTCIDEMANPMYMYNYTLAQARGRSRVISRAQPFFAWYFVPQNRESNCHFAIDFFDDWFIDTLWGSFLHTCFCGHLDKCPNGQGRS